MSNTANSLRQWARAGTFLALRGILSRSSPAIPGTGPEWMFRWLGFFEPPQPAEIIANYLRGYLFFGRNTPKGHWFHWYTLPVRSVITRATARVPKTQQRLLTRGDFEFRYDQDLEQIMRGCQQGRDGWLTEDAVQIYLGLQRLGLIASVGTYRDGKLIGGWPVVNFTTQKRNHPCALWPRAKAGPDGLSAGEAGRGAERRARRRPVLPP